MMRSQALRHHGSHTHTAKSQVLSAHRRLHDGAATGACSGRPVSATALPRSCTAYTLARMTSHASSVVHSRGIVALAEAEPTHRPAAKDQRVFVALVGSKVTTACASGEASAAALLCAAGSLGATVSRSRRMEGSSKCMVSAGGSGAALARRASMAVTQTTPAAIPTSLMERERRMLSGGERRRAAGSVGERRRAAERPADCCVQVDGKSTRRGPHGCSLAAGCQGMHKGRTGRTNMRPNSEWQASGCGTPLVSTRARQSAPPLRCSGVVRASGGQHFGFLAAVGPQRIARAASTLSERSRSSLATV